MNNKKIKHAVLFTLVAVSIILTSCGAGTTGRLTAAEEEAFKDYVMSSYFMLRGDEALAESRAAWPAHVTELSFPEPGLITTSTKQNYPEKGQRTTVSIVPTSVTNLYFVTNETTYPKREDSIVKTTESYYVKDVAPIGTYDSADLLWNTDSNSQDFNKRIQFETEYSNGTVRYEKVEANTVEDSIQYAAFDIDGDLTFPAANNPDGTWSPATDANALYSSMVSYIQEEGSALNVWSDYKLIIGTRYYTEHGSNPSKPDKTSVSYEKVIERKEAELSVSDKISIYIMRLFNDAPADMIYPGETLSETVIRYEILSNNQKTVNTQSTLYDYADGTSVVTFTANYVEAEDGSVTSAGEPVATYY